MRCSRSGMMLFGPRTIENGMIVEGKPLLRCSWSSIASHSSLSRPYWPCRSERSTGKSSVMGRTLEAA